MKSNINRKISEELKNNWSSFKKALKNLETVLKSLRIEVSRFSSSWNVLLPVLYYIYSFAFATHALFSFYGVDDFIKRDEYEKILKAVDKGGAVIITVVEDSYPRRFYPEVFVSNNNRLRSVDLT